MTTTVWDVRPLLATPTSPLVHYPHSALALLFLPSSPVSKLPSTSLSNLALASRRALNAARTLPALDEALDWTSKTLPIPARRSGTDSLNISNQISAGLTQMSWGAEVGSLAGWWVWAGELVIDRKSVV